MPYKNILFVVLAVITLLEIKAQDTSYTRYKEYLIGKINSAKCPYFIRFEENERSFYLHKEAYTAYNKMKKAAAEEGIFLNLKSAGRSFYYQKQIWERKFAACTPLTNDTVACIRDILEYSAMPGTSRHHWGTEIDLNNLSFAYFENGYGKKVNDWLQMHASDYGYCQVYDNQAFSHRLGYNYEPWHYSYIPLSARFVKDFINQVEYQDIKGFSGDRYAESLSIFEHFVSGIGFICKPQ